MKTPPSSAASTAAVQAFLASRASNANLSNAAATAALRSYTASPTPVGEIQTKRMVQRRGSASSNGSAAASTHRPGGLQRKNSSGSMTERTFRDPSPNRGGPSLIHLDDAPPVPALPRGYVSPPPVPIKSIRRPASVEPPERISSPTPKVGGRGVSLDRGPGMLPLRPDRGGKQKVTTLSSVGEIDRAQNRDSVNFSRPMSPQLSPPNSPLNNRRQTSFPSELTSTALSNRGPGLRDGEVASIQHSMQDIANRPVKKKKRLVAKDMAQGSHLHNSHAEVRRTGATSVTTPPRQPLSNSSTPSPLDPKSHMGESDDSTQLVPRRKKKKAVTATEDRPRSSYASDSDTQSERSSFSSDRPRSYNTRIGGLLAKQPSVVREDREAEEKEERRVPSQKKSDQLAPVGELAINPAETASKKLLNGQQHNRSASQPITSSTPNNVPSLAVPSGDSEAGNTNISAIDKASRHLSLSPTRAAHFANQLVLETPEVMKHQPPARSVSPAKSALKHSPSSRGPSPLGAVPGSWNQRNGRAASEASDTTSLVSDDGSRNLSRKKKGVKVSFDEEPVLVGRASSPPTSPDSPVIMSPQNKARNERAWPIAGQNSGQEIAAYNPDVGGAMQPTPSLPSFGSVRTKDTQEAPAGGNQNKAESTLKELSSSTDQIISRIFYQDSTSKGLNLNASAPGQRSSQRASSEPLPPEVTSVEGTGYHSDEENQLSYDQGKPPQLTSNLDNALPSSTVRDSVPSIAILPATPAVGTQDNDEYDWPSMPGGFPLSFDSLKQEHPSASAAYEHHATDLTPATIGIAEPEPEAAAAVHEARTPAVGHVAEGLQTQIDLQGDDEAEHTDGSIYSDAAEDFSDAEGDGFGSINAIIESPAKVLRATGKATANERASPETISSGAQPANQTRPVPPVRNESELSEPALEEGWDRAQAYWSGLSETRKKQIEKAAAPRAMDETLVETKPRPKKKKIAQKRNTQSPISEHPPLPPWPDKQYRDDITRPASPRASAMRQSMRNSQPDTSQETHMRSSMRNGGTSKSSRNSMSLPESRSAVQKRTRPTSAVAMIDYNKRSDETAPKHGRGTSATIAPSSLTPVPLSPIKKTASANPNLRRIKSSGSDSSSSFKKSRPSKPVNNQYTMKRSMRGGPAGDVPRSVPGKRSSSYSARSPSPNESARRPFSSGGSSMRTSMRGSADFSKQARTKSPSRFGFGKTSKSKLGPSTKSGFSSRFGDSSDEEGGPPIRGSRFADSSDDEDMAPVRGIPRRIDEGDSTDLEDSSAEPSPVISKTKAQISSKPPKRLEGSTLAAESLHSPSNSVSTATPMNTAIQGKLADDKDKKKRSFFGGLGSKKRDDPRVLNPDFGSPAERDALPERPKVERILSTGRPATGETSPIAASPKSPKLQRRNTPKRFTSDTWPLPEMPPKIGEIRPNTSDGNGIEPPKPEKGTGAQRPVIGDRRSTVQSEMGSNGVVVGKAGKKKRFPLLRKAFGLHD